MKKYFFLIFVFFFSFSLSYSQIKTDINSIFENSPEVYFRFQISSEINIHSITRMISVDHIKNGFVYAYANKKQFENFLSLQIDYEILISSSINKNATMCKSLKKLYLWDSYPTYLQYDSIMQKFANDYPNNCKLVDIGTSVKGRKIYFIEIADSINVKKNKPEFLYSSTMHGNELVGYILMLRLINYFLTNYGTNPEVDSLIKNIDIWINPLANPDGAYASNDTTVNNSTRYNANGVDLNRNYPDPQAGLHPDGEQYQPENIAMMNFMKQHHFILSANFHTGDEVVNYPWDTWSQLHADDEWFKWISHEYADTNQFYASSLLDPYFTEFDNGTTNGYAWYEVNGGRQDYVTYFLHGREVTIELYDQNQPDSNDLDTLWKANYHSFLNYIKNCVNGIQGTITDSVTGKPLRAMVEVLNHDADSSQVFSDSTYGYYHRMIYTGTYNLKFSASGYKNKIINNVNGYTDDKTILNVKLSNLNSIDTLILNSLNFNICPNFINPLVDFPKLYFELNNNSEIKIFICNSFGDIIYSSNLGNYTKGKYILPLNLKGLNSGVYYCCFRIENKNIVKKIVIIN